MSAEILAEKLPFRKRVNNFAKSIGESIFPKPIPRDELLRGIGAFEDAQTRQIMSHVGKNLSVTSWNTYLDFTLGSKNPDFSITEASIEERLSLLAEGGFVNKVEPDDPSGFNDYYITAKGHKILKALSRI